jgi:hypothetical protein
MLKYVLGLFLALTYLGGYAAGRHTQEPQDTSGVLRSRPADSVLAARRDSVRALNDSLQRISDSLSVQWTKRPDPGRQNRYVDSLVRINTVRNFDFEAHARRFNLVSNRSDTGKLRPKGEVWLPAFVFLLLVFFAVLRRVYEKDILLIFQSFLSNRVLNQISKESQLFSSWPAIWLFVLFGFTIGTLLYLSGNYFQLAYTYSGFQWLCILSAAVIGLFTLKIVLVKVVGFLFDVRKLAGEYVSILFLSYFNAAFLYLPLILAFSLSPLRYAEVYIYIAVILLVVVSFFQFLRTGANILANNRFPKMYLIIYLCALEVCPILILIKALRF